MTPLVDWQVYDIKASYQTIGGHCTPIGRSTTSKRPTRRRTVEPSRASPAHRYRSRSVARRLPGVRHQSVLADGWRPPLFFVVVVIVASTHLAPEVLAHLPVDIVRHDHLRVTRRHATDSVAPMQRLDRCNHRSSNRTATFRRVFL